MNNSLNPAFTSYAMDPSGLKPCLSQRILYVEDDDIWRELSTEALRKAGFRVDVAEDGEAGWEAIQLGRYDLLITDNDMPRLTGIELVRRLRVEGYTLPAVLASGSFSVESAQRDRSLRVTATLRKPFPPEQLLKTVETILRPAGGAPKRAAMTLLIAGQGGAHIPPVRSCGISD